jgi:hypothetical protein
VEWIGAVFDAEAGLEELRPFAVRQNCADHGYIGKTDRVQRFRGTLQPFTQPIKHREPMGPNSIEVVLRTGEFLQHRNQRREAAQVRTVCTGYPVGD